MTHLSLADEVENALRDRKPRLADLFRKTFSCNNNSPEGELKALNDYWRLELAKSGLPSVDERECLRNDLGVGIWLKYFKSHVLPTLVRFNLPTE